MSPSDKWFRGATMLLDLLLSGDTAFGMSVP